MRREELKSAFYRIEGAIDRYNKTGIIAELGTIAIELRGLLLGEALFISLARESNYPLVIYTIPLEGIAKTGADASWTADSIALSCEKPYTEGITVEEWLNMPVAEIKGSIFTPTRLICEVANTLGPAHYSNEISTALLVMAGISIGGVPSYFRTLLRFSEVLLKLGERFLAIH